MRRHTAFGTTSVLYAYQLGSGDELRDYAREYDTLIDARNECYDPSRIELAAVGMDRRRLQCELLRRRPALVILSGHGPRFGLFEAATETGIERGAAALAALLSTCSAASSGLLLMGCNSSRLAPTLVANGLRGVSYDDDVHAHSIEEFLAGFMNSYFFDEDPRAAYVHGCLSAAFDHWEDSSRARWFGLGFDLDDPATTEVP